MKEEYTIVSQNPFESGLKRMSVVVRVDSASGSQHVAFVKGAPEVICGLCKRSFQPSEDEIKQELSYWTKQGCRVLALAYKQLEIESAVGLKRSATTAAVQCARVARMWILWFCVFQSSGGTWFELSRTSSHDQRFEEGDQASCQ